MFTKTMGIVFLIVGIADFFIAKLYLEKTFSKENEADEKLIIDRTEIDSIKMNRQRILLMLKLTSFILVTLGIYAFLTSNDW